MHNILKSSTLKKSPIVKAYYHLLTMPFAQLVSLIIKKVFLRNYNVEFSNTHNFLRNSPILKIKKAS